MDALNLSDLPGEYATVGTALLAMLDDCPYLPTGIRLLYNNSLNEECVVLRTMGGTYMPDVIGGYSARMTFQIGYKSYPNSNMQSLKAQETADNIMKWLKNTAKPLLTDGREITRLEISDCVPIMSNAGNDKSVSYVANGVLHYEK